MPYKEAPPLELRPHHGLCCGFFRGKGYSAEFTKNMYDVLERLNSENPRIVMTSGADIICGSCPNNKNGVCLSSEKVSRYDGAVLSLCGLSEGDILNFEEFTSLIGEKIIKEKKLSGICGDCQWFSLCGKEEYFGGGHGT